MYITNDAYHLRYVSSFSDERLTNTEHNYRRIQCAIWQCASWQYGCRIAMHRLVVPKLIKSQGLCHQCDILSMHQLIQMTVLFHFIFIMTTDMQCCHRRPTYLLRLDMALLSTWMTYLHAEYVVADDSGNTGDDSSGSDTTEEEIKYVVCENKNSFPFVCTCKPPSVA